MNILHYLIRFYSINELRKLISILMQIYLLSRK